jgi:nucleotide-binding universal stress UspA family protein
MTTYKGGRFMAKRILAPVDSGEHVERIAPIVAALARDAGSTVRLLRVFPVPQRIVGAHGRTVAYVDQEMARLTAEGLADLRHVEAQLAGVPVETVVRFGDPAEEIALEAEAFVADLIALGSGRSGRLRSALAPDLAQRIERTAAVPTLTLRS